MRLPTINYRAPVQQRGRLPIRQPQSTMFTALAKGGLAAAKAYDEWYEQEAQTELAGAVRKAKQHSVELFERMRLPGTIDMTTVPDGVAPDMKRTEVVYDGIDTSETPRVLPRYEIAHEMFQREAEGFIESMVSNMDNDRAKQLFRARAGELYLGNYQDLLRLGYERRREDQIATTEALIDDQIASGNETGAVAALESARSVGLITGPDYTARRREIGERIDERLYNRAIMLADTDDRLDTVQDYLALGQVRGADGQLRDARLTEDQLWQLRGRVRTRKAEIKAVEDEAREAQFNRLVAGMIAGQVTPADIVRLGATGQLDGQSQLALMSFFNSRIARQRAEQNQAYQRARDAKADARQAQMDARSEERYQRSEQRYQRQLEREAAADERREARLAREAEDRERMARERADKERRREEADAEKARKETRRLTKEHWEGRIRRQLMAADTDERRSEIRERLLRELQHAYTGTTTAVSPDGELTLAFNGASAEEGMDGSLYDEMVAQVESVHSKIIKVSGFDEARRVLIGVSGMSLIDGRLDGTAPQKAALAAAIQALRDHIDREGPNADPMQWVDTYRDRYSPSNFTTSGDVRFSQVPRYQVYRDLFEFERDGTLTRGSIENIKAAIADQLLNKGISLENAIQQYRQLVNRFDVDANTDQELIDLMRGLQ